MKRLPGGNAEELYRRARVSDRGALARLITLIERNDSHLRALSEHLDPPERPAHVIGVTGAPGAGKSTLMNRMAIALARTGGRVALLLIDPSSPYSGGSILGDRMRLDSMAGQDNVYVRSMANRGQLGGLSAAAPSVIELLESVGWTTIIVETVGVGQSEFDIARLADTLMVVVNPGWGDVIQANKAGLLETADLFVINKADRQGLEDTRRDLKQLIASAPVSDWAPAIVETVATSGDGIAPLMQALEDHHEHIRKHRSARERLRARREYGIALELNLRFRSALERWTSSSEGRAMLDDVAAGSTSRQRAVVTALDAITRNIRGS